MEASELEMMSNELPTLSLKSTIAFEIPFDVLSFNSKYWTIHMHFLRSGAVTT